jgi:hypothetical protein
MERGIYHGLARSDHNFKPQWLIDPREEGPPRTGVVLIERYYICVPPERAVEAARVLGEIWPA